MAAKEKLFKQFLRTHLLMALNQSLPGMREISFSKT
jgi:hypothetical protein